MERKMKNIRFRTTNDKEIVAFNKLTDDGFEVIKRGWPDFLAIDWKNKIVKFIEIKPYKRGLKPAQRRVKEAFEMVGLKYELWHVKIKGDGTTEIVENK